MPSTLLWVPGEWITPPLSSGCLPGVMRARALNLKLIRELSLGPELRADDQVLLINSLSCRPLQQVNAMTLQPHPDAERLWRQLISS